jgi:hypothetical protein
LSEELSKEQSVKINKEIANLEIEFGFKKLTNSRNVLQNLIEKMGNSLSFFICTTEDLKSGEVARIFNLNSIEALFIDRIVFANVINSAKVVWGVDLLTQIPLLPIRRLDVFKSYFSFTNQILLTIAAYVFLPNATLYAIGTLKRSIHSCYFCYHQKTNSLNEEIAFLQKQLGESKNLKQLLELRRNNHNSFKFVLNCLPELFRLHFRTAFDNKFPFMVKPF